MLPLPYAANGTNLENVSFLMIISNERTCIFGDFVAKADEQTIFTLTLNTRCEFTLIDHQSNEQIKGGYSISDEIIKGSMSTIDFFIDGESIGEAVLAWPLEDDLCLIINGVVFRKTDKTKQ